MRRKGAPSGGRVLYQAEGGGGGFQGNGFFASRGRGMLLAEGDCFKRKVESGRGLHFKLTIPGFPYNILPYLVVTLAF